MSESYIVNCTKEEVLACGASHKVRKWVTKKLEVGDSIIEKDTSGDTQVNFILKSLGYGKFQLKQFPITQ